VYSNKGKIEKGEEFNTPIDEKMWLAMITLLSYSLHCGIRQRKLEMAKFKACQLVILDFSLALVGEISMSSKDGCGVYNKMGVGGENILLLYQRSY